MARISSVAKVIFVASCGGRLLHKPLYSFEQFCFGNGSSFSKSTGHILKMVFNCWSVLLDVQEMFIVIAVALFTVLSTCFSDFPKVTSQ
jgi:hypothetical protein